MSEMHKELLRELVQDWNADRVQKYIDQLKTRREDLTDEIKYLTNLLHRKLKRPVDTGARDGH